MAVFERRPEAPTPAALGARQPVVDVDRRGEPLEALDRARRLAVDPHLREQLARRLHRPRLQHAPPSHRPAGAQVLEQDLDLRPECVGIHGLDAVDRRRVEVPQLARDPVEHRPGHAPALAPLLVAAVEHVGDGRGQPRLAPAQHPVAARPQRLRGRDDGVTRLGGRGREGRGRSASPPVRRTRHAPDRVALGRDQLHEPGRGREVGGTRHPLRGPEQGQRRGRTQQRDQLGRLGTRERARDGRPVREPAELGLLGQQALGDRADRAPVPAETQVVTSRLDRPDPLVRGLEPRHLAASGDELFPQRRDAAVDPGRVGPEGVGRARPVHGDPPLVGGGALRVGGGDVGTEPGEAGRECRPDGVQRMRRRAGHEDAPARGQQVRDQVRDGPGRGGATRSLHEHGGALLDRADQAEVPVGRPQRQPRQGGRGDRRRDPELDGHLVEQLDQRRPGIRCARLQAVERVPRQRTQRGAVRTEEVDRVRRGAASLVERDEVLQHRRDPIGGDLIGRELLDRGGRARAVRPRCVVLDRRGPVRRGARVAGAAPEALQDRHRLRAPTGSSRRRSPRVTLGEVRGSRRVRARRHSASFPKWGGSGG